MKRRIGKYELLGPLGAGGMAVVYTARDTSLDRVVALKLIRQQLDGGETVRKRFLNEAKVLAGLRHSNIVHIYDFGIDEGAPYIVMEYLPGSDLYELIQKHYPLSVEQKLKIAVQVAKALRAAHQQGVVHRDIKPSNIRVLQDGVAKLMDFGIAILPSQELDRLTQTGAVLGSIRYMAPEQIHGQPVTPSSDIFSFGAVLYELLEYRPAFPGDSLGTVIAAISQDAPPRIADPKVPAALVLLVERCLRKSPADRWPSADRLLEGFNEVEEELWQAAMRDGSTQVGRLLLSDAEPLPEPAEQETVIVEPAAEKTTRSDPAPWKAATRKVAAPVELAEAPEVERPPGRGGWRWAWLGLSVMLAAAALAVLGLRERPGQAGPAEEVVLLPVGPLPTAGPMATAAAAPVSDLSRPAASWLAALRGADRAQRLQAARTLARMGRDAVEPLVEALRSPEAEVQILAATALGQIGPSANTAVPLLSDVAAEAEPLVRVWANYALARIDWMDPAAVAALRRSAEDGSEPVREAAARALQDLERGQR